MKKNLNIMMGDKPLRLDPAAAVNVKQKMPTEVWNGVFELLDATLPPPVIDHNIRLGV